MMIRTTVGRGIIGTIGAIACALASSCATREKGDFREVATPSANPEAAVPAAPGLMRQTTSRDSENLFFCPSPDGTWAVFATNRHSVGLRLYRTDLNRAGLLYAIPGADEGNNIFPSLDRSGTRLAFSSDREGVWRIYVLDLKPHAAPQAMTPGDGDCLSPAWSPKPPDGEERIAFSTYNVREERWDVCLLDVGSGQTAHLGPGLFPAWSPDGGYLAVQRPRERDAAQFGLWLLRVDGAEPDRELVAAENWAAANPCWSPDGTYVAFNSVGRGAGESLSGDGGGVYLVPLQGGGQLIGPLPGAEAGSFRPSWASSGKIYFHRREGDAVNVFAIEGPELGLRPELAGPAR